jgi:hypothetical protein
VSELSNLLRLFPRRFRIELSDNNSSMRAFRCILALWAQYSPLAVACIVARGAAAGTLQLITGITVLAVWCYRRGFWFMIPFRVSDTEGAGKHAVWSESP